MFASFEVILNEKSCMLFGRDDSESRLCVVLGTQQQSILGQITGMHWICCGCHGNQMN